MLPKKIIVIIASISVVIAAVFGINFLNAGFGVTSGSKETGTSSDKQIEEVATLETEKKEAITKDTPTEVDDESVSSEETTGESEKEVSSTDESTSKGVRTTKPTAKTTAAKSTTTTTKRVTAKPNTTIKPTTTKPTTTKSTTTAAQTVSRVTGFESEMLTIINQYRAEVGVAPLATTTALNNAAAERAKETIESFSHTRPDGSECFTILDEFKISYGTAGENIAWGQRNVSSVMTAWYNSEGHKTNMQNSKFGHVGFGCYTYNGTRYWVQLFTD